MQLPLTRRPLRPAPILAFLLLGLLAASPARAVLIGLDVVPGLSRVSIEGTSQLVVDPGAPLDPVTIPVVPQTGAGTSGAPLPGGGSSDGLTAAVGGFLLADFTGGAFPTLDFLASTSLLDVLPSGDWAPGPSGSGPAAPADLAFALDGGSDVALSLQAAVRELALGTSWFAFPVETAPGEFAFDVLGTDLEIVGGAVDVASDVPGLGGRFGLSEGPLAFGAVPIGQGVLRDLGGGDFLLEVDLAFQLVFGPDEIRLPLPGELTVDVGAEIVAASFVVPEPRPAPLLALALLVLPLAIRPARARAVRSAGPILLLALVAGFAAGFGCPDDEEADVNVTQDQCESQMVSASAGEEGQPPADEETKSSAAPDCGVPSLREAAAEASNGEATVRVHSAIVQDNLLTGGTYECRTDFESLGTVTSTLPVLQGDCAIDAVESFDFEDSQGGGGEMVLRAGLDSLRQAAESVSASVQVECGAAARPGRARRICFSMARRSSTR